MSQLFKMMSAAERKAPPVAIEVPRSFIAFCTYLGVELTPGQRMIARLAYDGARLADLAPEELELARAIFGALEEIPRAARSVFAAVCGGRGGKSYALVALRLVWGMFTRDLSSLAPGQHAVALVVAPNDKLRQEVVNYAIGAIRSHEALRATLRLPRGTKDEDVVSSFSIERPDGHRVDLEAGVATRGGYGGRGRSLTDFAMDESAFFRDASYKVNDADIFKGASPRVLPGGQTIVASTPWGESGLLYDLWARNFGKPQDALVAHAPTLLLHDTPWTREIVERERTRDPENADREFDAKFLKGGTTVFFEPSAIEAAISDELGARMPLPGETVSAGGDFGFRSDSSALAIAHLSGKTRLVAELVELRPDDGMPLKPSVTVARFAERLNAHGATYLMADGHYRESIDEHLSTAGLAYCAAPNTPADAYMRARMLLRSGLVKIPRNPRLIQQMKEVQGRPLPGGGMAIIHPRWRTGGHGDLVAALVLALYQLGGDVIEAPAETEGTKEWEEKQRDKRRATAKEQASASWWRKAGGRR